MFDYTLIALLALETVAQVSTILAGIVFAVTLVWGALVGLAIVRRYISSWIGHRDMPSASTMSREQRNRRYEDFYDRRLERGIERF